MEQGIDVSQYQGSINWSEVPEPIAIVKMSGGDAGLYLDVDASKNYYGAKVAGKTVGMYHFAGGTSAVVEADYFVKACSPLAENDVLVVDWEVSNPDPVSWVNTFVTEVHSKTTVWPLVYMNLSTLNAYDWSSVLKNCGLWIADWAVSPQQNIPITKVYVAQQYSDSGPVPGIVGRVDLDAWFGTLAEFQAYGYHVSQPTSPPPAQPSTPQPQPSPSSTLQTPPVTASVYSLPPVSQENTSSAPSPDTTPVAPVIELPPASAQNQTASVFSRVIKWIIKQCRRI